MTDDQPRDPLPRARPRVVQGSRHPVFSDTGSGGQFACSKCQHVLIAGFDPRKFLALDIQCWACGEVSTTPQWPDGEPLPQRLITLGSAGSSRLNQTLDLTARQVTFTCDQEIERIQAKTELGPFAGEKFALSVDGLAAVEARLEVLCEGFGSCLAKTRRAFERGNSLYLQYLPAWSLAVLQRSAAAGVLDIDDAGGAAYTFLSVVLSLLPRWEHHERFPALRKAFLYEAPHAMAQLVAASYLAEAGNPIGFSQPKKGGGRSSDMVIHFDAFTPHSLEVKAPAELQWPNLDIGEDKLGEIIRAKLKATAGQITKETGGALVLGASIAAPTFREKVTRVVEAMIEAQELPRRVSGIMVANIRPRPVRREGKEEQGLDTQVEFTPFANPRYQGAGRIVIPNRP